MDAAIQSHIKKHIGSVKNTGARIYLVFRKLPDDANSCLVVMADALPDQYFDALHGLVMSREAQETVDLYEVFHRHSFQNGDNVLRTLHEKQLLVKVPVDTIVMEALPGHRTDLRIINDSIDGTAPAQPAAPVAPTAPVESAPSISPTLTARDLLAEANDLEARAKSLRAQAKILDPNAGVKKAPGRPDSGLSADQKRDIRNQKRRDKYQKDKKA